MASSRSSIFWDQCSIQQDPKTSFSEFFPERYLEKIGAALRENGTENGMIVHGRISNDKISGVDELTACGNNQVFGFGSLQTQGVESWKPSRWNQEEFDFQDLKRGQLGRKFIHYAKSSFSRLPARFMGDHNDQCCHSLCALRQIFQP